MAIAGDDASQPCGTTIDSVASPTSHFPSRSATSAPSAAPSCSGSPGYPPVRRAAAGFTAVDRRAATGAASQGRGAAAGAASPGRGAAAGATVHRADDLQRELLRGAAAAKMGVKVPSSASSISFLWYDYWGMKNRGKVLN